MKKVMYLFLCVVLSLSVAIPAAAADEYGTAMDLYESWGGNYPEYISGVWSTDGSSYNLTFGICSDADVEKVKAELLLLIEDDTSASFAVQKYSYAELSSIANELHAYFPSESTTVDYGMVSTAVCDRENYVKVEFLTERMNDSATVDLINLLCEKYGDAVEIGYNDGYYFLISDIQMPVDLRGGVGALTVALSVVMLMLVLVLFMVVRRRSSAVKAQISDGNTVSVTKSVSTQEVERMVRTSELKPSDELDKRMQAEIENRKNK